VNKPVPCNNSHVKTFLQILPEFCEHLSAQVFKLYTSHYLKHKYKFDKYLIKLDTDGSMTQPYVNLIFDTKANEVYIVKSNLRQSKITNDVIFTGYDFDSVIPIKLTNQKLVRKFIKAANNISMRDSFLFDEYLHDPRTNFTVETKHGKVYIPERFVFMNDHALLIRYTIPDTIGILKLLDE